MPDDARGVVLKLDPARLDVLVWTLVYGGLLVVAVGLALGRNGAGYGFWGVVVSGAVVVAAGAVALRRRSRIRDVEP